MTPFLPPLTVSEVTPGLVAMGYVAQSRIDGGGQGDVFQCSDSAGTLCAAKVFIPQAKPRVDAEVGFLSSVSSKGIVRLFEHALITVRGADCPLTIMEYVEGQSIRRRIAAGRLLTEADATCMISCIADAIEVMWAHQKVHRDIKPDNILVREDGTATLIDFGIVRHLDLPSMTIPGAAPGTQGYKSPEHDSAIRNPTYKADVFSLGVTAYEGLTGLHPFGGSQDAINRGFAPAPIETIANISSGLAELVTRMLSTRAVLRPEIIELTQGGQN